MNDLEKNMNPERELRASKLLHELELSGAKIIERDGVEYYEIQDPVALFEWAKSQGFLFHGSPSLTKTLEPRQAKDKLRESGSKNAVYLTENYEVSMAKAIIGNQTGGYNFKRDSTGKLLSSDIYVEDQAKLNDTGYMYIIDPSDSEDFAENEHFSYGPVSPIAIVRFSKANFRLPIQERKAETTTPFEGRTPNASLLLTPEEEKAAFEKKKGSSYIFTARNGDTEILVLGLPHEYRLDPFIETGFSELQPNFVLIEGSAEVPVFTSLEQAALRAEAKGMAVHLAREKDIPYTSWDLDFKVLLEEALAKHEEDAVVGWALAQGFKHLRSRNPTQLITADSLSHDLLLYKEIHDSLKEDRLSAENLQRVIRKFSGKSIEQLIMDDAEQVASPRYTGPTNQVVREMNYKRDRHAIAEIYQRLLAHKKVLVVAGSGHAATWVPVMKDLFGDIKMI